MENTSDRFLLLDEVCNILAAKGIDPANLLKSLLKTYDGELTFNFGNTLIQLEHTKVIDIYSKKDTEEFTQDIIEISISTINNFTEKILTHIYRPKELANMINLSEQKNRKQTTEKPKKKQNQKLKNQTKNTTPKNRAPPKEKYKLTGKNS